MSKVKSLDELKKLREQAKGNTSLRTTSDNPDRTVIAIGMATCGIAAGARKSMAALLDEMDKTNVQNISVIATGCLGYCYAEPLVEIREPGKEPLRYANVDEDRAREIVQKHIIRGELVDNAILGREVPKL